MGREAEFDWVGTRDPSAWLSTPAAIDFHVRSGGHRLRERNMRLARDEAGLLAKHWNTERGSCDALTGSMSTLRLPVVGEATDEGHSRSVAPSQGSSHRCRGGRI
jgi:isopenicillin-N epimerase